MNALAILSLSIYMLAADLVPWTSDESALRLSRSTHRVDFFPLSNHFESQDNAIVCGLASSTIVLNALRLGGKAELPVDKSSIALTERDYLPEDFDPFFKKYTQTSVLTPSAKKRIEIFGKPVTINGKETADFGMQLRQLQQALESNGLHVKLNVVTDKADVKKIKAELIQNLKTKNDYVLVNYARKALGQTGGGHISPLGAYDQKSDSFLVMDVNPNKAPWVWVKASDLIAAMKTFDTIENRGYLLISDKQ